MASIVGGGGAAATPPRIGLKPRKRPARRATALASASALVGAALLLLSDPGGGGGGFRGDDGGGGRAAVVAEERALKEEDDAGAGLVTFRMYTAPYHARRRASSTPGDLPDDGGGDRGGHEGLHFVDLYVGDPAQRRTLAVMTGSDYTAFPCGDCPDCPPSMTQFQSDESPSFARIPCGRCLSSGGKCSPDGTSCLAAEKGPDRSGWAGYEARDAALLGADRSAEGTDAAAASGFPLSFACQTSARGRFAHGVRDGVLGFSPAPTSFVAQMHAAGRLAKARFSLCFEPSDSAPRVAAASGGAAPGPSADAGAVTLGGYDPYNLDTPMTYARSAAFGSGPGEDTAGYRVRVTGMYLREGGGNSVRPDRGIGSVRLRRVSFDPDEFNAGGGGMAVDSGALRTVFHAGAEETFREIWNRSTGGGQFSLGKVFLTEEELQGLPTIILQFQAYEGVDTSLNPNTIPNMAGDLDPDNPHDALIAIPPSSYMERNPTSGAYRPGISFESTGGTVLGSNAMRGHTILYDLQRGRVGFAESRSCEKAEQRTVGGGGGDFDDDMYAVAEETGAGGVHMVEGTLTDDDVFGVPVESAAVPPADSLREEDPPPGRAPADAASGGDSPPAAVPEGDKPPPKLQMPPPAKQNSHPAAQAQRAETTEGKGERKAPKVGDTGRCTSVTCRVWVGVGYFFVGCLLGIAYRTAKTHRTLGDGRLAEEEEEEEERRRLSRDHPRDGGPEERFAARKEVWEGPPPPGEKEVWEGPPVGEEPVYGSEVQKDLYDLEEVEEEYDREMPAHWR